MNTAKIFWSGRSQAVRLPKSFRFDAEEVRIRRNGNAVILEPVAKIGRGSMQSPANSTPTSSPPSKKSLASSNARRSTGCSNDALPA